VIGDRRVRTLLSCALLLTSCGRSETGPRPASPPAKVTSPVTEATLTTVTLTADAVTRLGIETAAVEERGVARTRTVGGEVVAAGGAQSTVTAPFAGTLEGPDPAPSAGTSVRKGATIFRLVPLAAAERDVRIEAERMVGEASGRQEMAAKRAERAAQLARDGSGSQRAAEEAQADLAVANAAQKAARDRFALASRGVSASGAISLDAPYAALLRAVHAGAGQTVAAGAPLFDVVRLDTVWIRVPLYAGDIDFVDRSAAARIVPLGAVGAEAGQIARPVAAPPSADPSTAAVDLYYEVANTGTAFRPGQRVGVRLPLKSDVRSLVVPRGAILYDAYGGAWVYEARDAHVFARRRVSVVDSAGDMAVLDRGPAPGARVVTVGAAELFGTEFGAGK
jgi:membrane fusion protein, heavy metal efflux system